MSCADDDSGSCYADPKMFRSVQYLPPSRARPCPIIILRSALMDTQSMRKLGIRLSCWTPGVTPSLLTTGFL